MKLCIDFEKLYIVKLIRRIFNIPPKNWYRYHLSTCGTKYRGCDHKCPKDVWEKTGKWTLK